MVKVASIRCSALSATDAIDLGNFKSAHLQLPVLTSFCNTAVAHIYMDVFNSATSTWSAVGGQYVTGVNPVSGSSALAPWVLSSTVGGYSVNIAPACELGTIRLVTGGTNSTMTAATNLYVLVGTGYAR